MTRQHHSSSINLMAMLSSNHHRNRMNDGRGSMPLKALLIVTLFCSLLLSAVGDEPNTTVCEDCNSMCKDLAESRVEAATMSLESTFQEKIDLLETSLASERESLASSEGAREDLDRQLANAASVESALRKEVEEQHVTLLKNAENSILYKTKSEKLERELSALQKSLKEHKKESNEMINVYKAKLLEALNKQHDLERKLLGARERERDLQLRAIPIRVNMTLIMEDIHDFAETVWGHSVGFGTWLKESFHGIVDSTQQLLDLVIEQMAPSVRLAVDAVQGWYDANLKPTVVKHIVPVMLPLKQTATDLWDKVHAAISSGLKHSCRNGLAYLEHNVEVTRESVARKWVVSQLEYAEEHCEHVVSVSGQAILVFALVVLVLKLTRKRKSHMVVEKANKAGPVVANAGRVGRKQ